MARRKTGFLSDGESSGDSNADSDELDDGHHKRQRRGGKEDALYGVFAEDDDSGLGTRRERVSRVDFTRGPTFTTGSSSSTLATPSMDNLSGHQPVPIEASGSAHGAQTTGLDDAEEDGEDDDSEDDDSDNSDSDARPAPARVRDDEESEDEMPSMASFKGKGRAAGGGLGSAASETSTAANTPPPTNAPKASFFAPPTSSYAPGPSSSDNVPTSFASAPKSARSFLLPSQKAAKPAPIVSTADLSKDDVQALNKLQGSFGARMLGKMGWSAGSGLGQDGAGIVAPIDVKLRPSKMGLGGKGFKERTDQSIREAIRNGDLPAPEKKEAKSKGGKKKDGKDLGAAIESAARGEEWKRKKKIKTKVTHLTYEEILEQSGGAGVGASTGVGVIIDATGATPREISSLSQSAQPWSSASMPTARLPELRHNLRTITSQTVMALEALAKEGVSVREKRHRLAMEEESLRRRIEAEALQIARLQTLHTLIDEIKEVSKTETALRPATSAASAAGINSQPRLEAFDAVIDRLVFEFGPEFDALGLDEVVVGAIAPAVKRLLVEWKPLEEDGILPHLRKWRKAFRLALVEDEGVVDVYGQTRARERKEVDREMTPFESLIWNLWLPKVRSAINNDWTPVNPSPAIYLYTTWSSLLPQFVKDNILDQLILPKLSKAVNEWKPRRDGSGPTLGSLIFPWLQVLQSGEGGEGRGQEILEEGKRRMRGVVKGWRIGEEIPTELLDWKKVFARNEWDSLLLKYVLPKLGAHLRSNFTVNPRAQSLEPLQEALKWKGVLRSRMLSQLMDDEFVAKWLDVLYIWLVSPKPSFDEVTQWYSYWKTVFPEDVFVLKGVQSGFRRGLDLMNQAMSLGPEAVSQLPRPSLTAPLPHSPRSSAKRSTNGTTDASGRHSRRPDRKDEDEVTFRELAEAFVVERDLIWAPTGRSDLNTGQPLFRISKDGRTGGCVGYVSGDAFYVLEGLALDGVGKPIGLEEVVKRAEGKTVS